MNEDSIVIGIRDGWGQDMPFGISLPDLRQHVYLIGKTGSGKTTLLRNMIVQHIALGHGVGLIDPHGDLAEELLGQIPQHRTDSLTYFDPSDLEFPIPLNLLANIPKDERHLVASGIVGSFKSIWRESWGPRMEYILYNALAALLDCPNTSLLGLNRLLTDAEYRAWVVRQTKDPFIKEFWEHEFASYEPRFQREAIAPIQNKIGQFLLTPVIRNILGQVKCRINFPFMMDDQWIFIANLSKGKLGPDKANLLGSLLVTQFQLAAMRRASQPEHERRDFYLFIDEFQNFTTDAFASLLAEARKYRLCLTLSHQYVEQIPADIRRAVFGNAGTLLSFRVGFSDAEVLQKEFANSHTAQQFVDLERFELIARVLQNGANTPPFKGKTLQPLANTGQSPEQLLTRARRRFTVRRSSVESKLNRFVSAHAFPRKQRKRRPTADSHASNSSLASGSRKPRKYGGFVLPV
jgi:hypothetical protein